MPAKKVQLFDRNTIKMLNLESINIWEMGWDGDISKWRDAKMYDFSSGQLIKRE